MPHRTPRTILAALFLGALTANAGAQGTTDPTPDAPNPPDPQPRVVSVTDALQATRQSAEPIRRAGLSSAIIERTTRVVPVVAIVSSPSAYLDAIGAWEAPVRFPVLYDDGSPRAREDIARFVRAFKPERVVRATGDTAAAWSSDPDERRAAIETAMTRALSDKSSSWSTELDAMKESGLIAPGVVAIDPSDPLWAGGLALAAARYQRPVFIDAPDDPYADLEPAQGDAIALTIERALRDAGLDYTEIGDDIDAVTLAARMGVRIRTGPGDRDIVATTDRIGRADKNGSGPRWGYATQLFGNTATSVYQAMCAIFLPIDRAWIWDGYDNTGDWSRFDGSLASEYLMSAGFETDLHDEPRNTSANFKLNSAVPLDASLLLMNSKGSKAYYDLPGIHEGAGSPGDLPILNIPAALHMVHSFSLAQPVSPRTVGGRWLERGVYLYAGSVDEPYLSGFVPTPDVTRRLLGQLTFASAVRYDGSPKVWKIAVLGDALKTFGPVAEPDPELLDILQIEGDVLDERAKSRLKAEDFEGAVLDLIALGRDDDAARLSRALLKDRPESVTDPLALGAINAALRSGDTELVLDLFETLDPKSRTDRIALDALWLAGRSRIARLNDQRAMALLRTNLREAQEIRDAEELAMILRRDSMSSAIGFLESIRSDLKDYQRAQLDRAILRVRR
jgi:hypothetical protein